VTAPLAIDAGTRSRAALPPCALVLLDSGGANLGSVQAALARLGIEAPVTADPVLIATATHVILPGVGAAQPAMERLRANGLDRLIPTLAQPVLGICLGMQLLFERSEEGGTKCLGILPGVVHRFDPAACGRVPHQGWNRLLPRCASPLLAKLGSEPYAYFVHSYAAPVNDATLATCEYGGPFAAVVGRGNFYGAQFHPERSATVGAQLLRNFLTL
jgi:glutamine amidotransferase